MNKKCFIFGLILYSFISIQIMYGMKEEEKTEVPLLAPPKFKKVVLDAKALDNFRRDLVGLNANLEKLNQQKNLSFFQRRLQNADQLLSTILINGGFQLFTLAVGKAWNHFFDDSSKLEKQLNDLDTLSAQLALYDGKLKINKNVLRMYENKVNKCRNPEKRKQFEQKYLQHLAIEQSIRRKVTTLQAKFASSDVELQELKRKEPKTIFENHNGELVTVAPPEENNSEKTIEPTNENTAPAFFTETAEAQQTTSA